MPGLPPPLSAVLQRAPKMRHIVGTKYGYTGVFLQNFPTKGIIQAPDAERVVRSDTDASAAVRRPHEPAFLLKRLPSGRNVHEPAQGPSSSAPDHSREIPKPHRFYYPKVRRTHTGRLRNREPILPKRAAIRNSSSQRRQASS